MATLITGADGHLGLALARHLLESSDVELLLYSRASSGAEREAKQRRLSGFAGSPRCRLEFGDLRDPDPFGTVPPAMVDRIIHAAALTDFGIARRAACAVNVDGTAKLIAFAERCNKLEKLAYLSTLYAAGLEDGSVDEAPFDRPERFANHYEWSKWEAEALLQGAPGLPWQVYRVATLLCDDESGTVRQYNVIHNTLRLLYYGLLSVVPGHEATRVYMTTTEAAVAAIGTLLGSGPDRAFYNVSNSATDALTLAELLEQVYAAFSRDEAFARHGILKPRFCDQASFDLLAESAAKFGSAIGQGLDSITPFAPQLFSDKAVRNDRAVAAMPSADPARLLPVVSEHLIATRWGRRSGAGETRQCA